MTTKGNALAVAQPMFPGLAPDLEALQLARSFRPGDAAGGTMIDRRPTEDERLVMGRRAKDLGRVLMPIGYNMADDPQGCALAVGDRTRVAQALALLFTAYIQTRNDPNSAKLVASYVTHLESLPAFAIEAAISDIKNNRVYDRDRFTGNLFPLDPDRPPSAIRIGAVAGKHAAALAEERHLFDRVLSARQIAPAPLTKDERERVHDGMRQLSASLRNAAADRVQPGPGNETRPLSEVGVPRVRALAQQLREGGKFVGMTADVGTSRTKLVSPQLNANCADYWTKLKAATPARKTEGT